MDDVLLTSKRYDTKAFWKQEALVICLEYCNKLLRINLTTMELYRGNLGRNVNL